MAGDAINGIALYLWMSALPCASEIGARSEGIILGEFIRRGYTVLVPFGGHAPYDLVIERDGVLQRVQCKTAHLKKDVLIAKLYSTTIRAGGVSTRRTYEGRVDLFAIYSAHTNKVYVIPIGEAPRLLLHLRLTAARNGQGVGVKMAVDYELR